MGNSCSKRTKKEVVGDLEGELLSSAKQVLKDDFPSVKLKDGASLQDATEALAIASFKKNFGYDWSPTNCQPTDLDKEDPRVHPASDFCIVVEGDEEIDKAIAKYVSDGLKSAGLEQWVKDNAVTDLGAIIKKYFDYPTDNRWHYGPGNEEYDAADTNADSYKLDVSIVYTNATKTESAVEATLHILYFVGVYYTVKSPKAATFEALRSAAYDRASTLPEVNIKPKNDIELQKALLQYGNPIYKNQWGYSYGSSEKPKDAATDETEPVYSHNEHLAYWSSRNQTDSELETFVDVHIMKGFNMPSKPDPKVPTSILTPLVADDVLKSYKTCLKNSDSQNWNYVELNTEYGLKMASVRPLRLNALIIYYSAKKNIYVNNEDVEVDMIYLYFFGLLYELEEDPIMQDMKHVLVKNVPHVDTSTIPKHINSDALRDYIETWNRTQFENSFDTKFPTSDANKDPKTKHWRSFFEFDSWYPSTGDIKDKVSNQIFPPDVKQDDEIHHDLQEPVYNWIVDHFADFAGKSYAKDNNEWYNQTKTNNFPYKGKNSTDWILSVSASWVYANATITEDGRGGETINYFYLQVLIYVNASLDASSDSDV